MGRKSRVAVRVAFSSLLDLLFANSAAAATLTPQPLYVPDTLALKLSADSEASNWKPILEEYRTAASRDRNTGGQTEELVLH